MRALRTDDLLFDVAAMFVYEAMKEPIGRKNEQSTHFNEIIGVCSPPPVPHQLQLAIKSKMVVDVACYRGEKSAREYRRSSSEKHLRRLLRSLR